MEKKEFGVLLAVRNDGAGERLRALINAMYLSEKLEIPFGFVWRGGTYIAPISENAKGVELLYTKMASEDEIFNQDFIEKYSYTKKLSNKNVGILITEFKGKTLEEFKSIFCEKNVYYHACQYDLTGVFADIDKEDYYNYFARAWKEIGFSDGIKKAINMAKEQASFLNFNFVSIHMRGGDIVYSENRGRWQKMASLKVIPIGVVCDIIENREKNFDVVLFSDDLSSAKNIKEHYKGKRTIFTTDDFDNCAQLSMIERIFYDITLCSLSSKIYIGNISGFGVLASRVNGCRHVYGAGYEGVYTKQEQIKLILENDNKIKLNTLRKSYEYYLLYRLSMGIGSIDTALQYVKKALKYDKDNNALRVFIIAGLLLNKKYLLCEKYLKLNLKYNKNFIEMLFFGYSKGSCAFEYEISVILNNYPNGGFSIETLCALIYEFKKKYSRIHEYKEIFSKIENGYHKYRDNKIFNDYLKVIEVM